MADTSEMRQILWKGFLSVNNAESIKEELTQTLSRTDNLIIDLSAVEDIDVSIIQLMWAVKKEALQAGKKCSFTGTVSPDVRKCLMVCGIIEEADMGDDQITAVCSAFAEEQA